MVVKRLECIVTESAASLWPLLSVCWSVVRSVITSLRGRVGKKHFHAPIGALLYCEICVRQFDTLKVEVDPFKRRVLTYFTNDVAQGS